jgi:hypothetical protein
MARGKKHTAEQIVNLLRPVEVGVANGKTLPQACKEAEILSPERRRCAVSHAQRAHGMSERRACRVVNAALSADTARRRQIRSPRPSSRWPANMVAMGIAGLRCCSDGQAGRSARTGWSGSGVVRG